MMARYLIYDRFYRDKFLQYADILSVSNISLIVLDEKRHGYYIHGRSVHQIADTDVKELNESLRKEENDMVPARGLDQTDQQVFEIFVTPEVRSTYDKIYGIVVSADPFSQMRAANMRLNKKMKGADEISVSAYQTVNNLFDKNFKEFQYSTREKTYLEKMFGATPDVYQGSVFLNDPYGYTQVLLHGLEPIKIARKVFQDESSDDEETEVRQAEQHILTAVDSEGNTVAHWAAMAGRGFSVAAAQTTNHLGETPLMRAVMDTRAYERGTFDEQLRQVFTYHESGTDFNARDHHGRTALHHAVLGAKVRRRVGAARFYVASFAKAKQNQINRSQSQNVTLGNSQSFNSSPSLNININVDAQDANGDTPLHVACRVADQAIAAVLAVEMNASTSIKNNAGITPLDLDLNALLNLNAASDTAVPLSLSPRMLNVASNHVSLLIPPNLLGNSHSHLHHHLVDFDGFADSIVEPPSLASLQELSLSAMATHITAQQSNLSSLQDSTAAIESLTRQRTTLKKRCAHLLTETSRASAAASAMKARIRKLDTVLSNLRKQHSDFEIAQRHISHLIESSFVTTTSDNKVLDTYNDSCKKSNSLAALIDKMDIEEDSLLQQIDNYNQGSGDGDNEQLCKLIFSASFAVPLDSVNSLIDPLVDWLKNKDED
ncbi:Meckelin [Physocladia obscura]|uniref:Meckelin n=1 Tax=Physocladia obscura TaxID=109957 RepID=A0AAD5T611_9FUNG|nr:Meckelin [Physocladia obscura]